MDHEKLFGDVIIHNRDILSPKTIVNARMQNVFDKDEELRQKAHPYVPDSIGRWEDDYYYTYNVHTGLSQFNKILYKLNKQGFRSNNFNTVNKEKFTVLYSGCSVTFGQDLPEEMLWTKLVTKELSKNKEVEEYNLSIMGGSIFLTLSNICAFINTYGMPNLIIALMPDITRTITFDPTTSEFFDLTPKMINANAKDFIHQLMPENLLLNDLLMFKLLELLCKNSGSRFLFSSYEKLTNDCFVMFADDLDCWFESGLIFPRPPVLSAFAVKPDYGDHESPYWEIAGDKKHPGGGWHDKFAKRVFEIL